jgi:steroid delta-isomerase-like uncharacterized protein
MSKDKQAVFDLLTELWNTANSELVTEVYTEKVERIDPNSPEPTRGRQQIADYISAVHSGFPDFKLEIKERIIEGDQVATEWTCTGTHKGVFQGIPPTGRRVTILGVSLNWMEGGKIAVERAYFDRLSMLQQLGVLQGTVQGEANSAAGS